MSRSFCSDLLVFLLISTKIPLSPIFRETEGYDLFSADKIIIMIEYPKNNPITTNEINEIDQFDNMFRSDTHNKWGINEKKDDQNCIVVHIAASNLHSK